MFILSLFGFLSIVFMTFSLGGGLPLFFNFPSIIIVFIPALLAGFISVGRDQFVKSLSLLVDSHKLSKCKVPEKSIRFFDVVGNMAMLMGWFGVISGAASMAASIEPEIFHQVIGPATSVCLLTLLYAVIVKGICYLAKQRILSCSLDAK